MQAIDTLIKAARLRVDETQRALARAEEERVQIIRTQTQMERAVEAEANEAGADPASDAGVAFSLFLRRIASDRARLNQELARLAQATAMLRADLGEAFIELKKLETLAERIVTRDRLEAQRRDTAMLDELALSARARRGA